MCLMYALNKLDIQHILKNKSSLLTLCYILTYYIYVKLFFNWYCLNGKYFHILLNLYTCFVLIKIGRKVSPLKMILNICLKILNHFELCITLI